MSESRHEFVQRVAEALGRRSPLGAAPAPPALPDDLVRLVRHDEDLVGVFAERAAAARLTVHRCDAGALTERLIEVLRGYGIQRATASFQRLDEREALCAAITAAGVELADWGGVRDMTPHFQADAGLSDVHAAIAETGSIVCCSSAAHGRGLSLAPPRHIAIVRARDIVADLMDYTAALRGTTPQDLPSAQAIITGPSKTADIEGVLVTGIHGPETVDLLLVEGA